MVFVKIILKTRVYTQKKYFRAQFTKNKISNYIIMNSRQVNKIIAKLMMKSTQITFFFIIIQ